MEALAMQLAEILQITIDKAIELLPVIREQFIAYKIITKISTPITIFTIISVLALVVAVMIYIMLYEYLDEEWKDSYICGDEHRLVTSIKKMLKPVAIITTTGIVVSTILKVLPFILAPDFMMIKEFIL